MTSGRTTTGMQHDEATGRDGASSGAGEGAGAGPATDAGTAVRLVDVHKRYPLGDTEVHALRGISLSLREGDFVSVAGPSGSGKSTLLNLLGCIDVASSGTVEVAGADTATLSDRAITKLRRETIGFIFQSFNLIPVLSVTENIELPLLLGGTPPPRSERRAWIDELVEAVGLSSWRRHRPSQLSGGQRQRVAIARALATHPRIVLADEPTANLDSATGESIIELMKRINAEFATTFVFSTHDPSIVSIADHVIRLHDGEVVEDVRNGVRA